jgi:hypothetical protein
MCCIYICAQVLGILRNNLRIVCANFAGVAAVLLFSTIFHAMPGFCPVPHLHRDQVWLAVGLAAGFGLAKLLNSSSTAAAESCCSSEAKVCAGDGIVHEHHAKTCIICATVDVVMNSLVWLCGLLLSRSF